MNKIILGTAQFGMDYGINNKRGRIPPEEVSQILRVAAASGIDTIDTAGAYGESEETLGGLLGNFDYKWRIVSKPSLCEYSHIETALESSLDKLDIPKLYGYLIHNFKDYDNDRNIWNKLQELKYKGRIEKIGFSLYHPQELESILKDNLDVDLIQVPFNIFDQRFKPYFSKVRKLKVEIHVRSVFLQGLVFQKAGEMDAYFDAIKERMSELNSLSVESAIPILALCLNFALENEDIDKVIVGVDSLCQLKEITEVADYTVGFNADISRQLSNFKTEKENIILPFNWPAKRMIIA